VLHNQFDYTHSKVTKFHSRKNFSGSKNGLEFPVHEQKSKVLTNATEAIAEVRFMNFNLT
jgi:hypothetical protein